MRGDRKGDRMKKTGVIAAFLLLASQCAAIKYERPAFDRAETEAAAAAIEQAPMPVKSEAPVDELVAVADRAAQRLRDHTGPLCEAIGSETCGFALRIAGNEEANAFADEKGTIWITVALLRYLETEDEVAAMLAHEIAHRMSGHDASAATAARYYQAMRYTLGGSSPSSAASRQSASARHLIALEADADYLAAFLLKRAGYDLTAAETLWITLAKVSNNKAASIMATHPLSAERLAAWRRIAAELDADPEALPRVAGD